MDHSEIQSWDKMLIFKSLVVDMLFFQSVHWASLWNILFCCLVLKNSLLVDSKAPSLSWRYPEGHGVMDTDYYIYAS
jgi:hypothetical protein